MPSVPVGARQPAVLKARQGAGTAGARRLLLISPGFPPSAAVGGLRWQKMLRLLDTQGWEADVLTVLPTREAEIDRGRLADLPDSTHVLAISAAAFEDRALRQLLALIKRLRPRHSAENQSERGQQGDVSPAVRPSTPPVTAASSPSGLRRAMRTYLHRRAQNRTARVLADACRPLLLQHHHVIVSSGPPHSAHLAARRVARQVGLPWIMDWRDPWTFDEFLESFDPAVYAAMERGNESRCIRDASLIVANTPAVERKIAELYPAAASRLLTIPNGSDAESLPVWGRSERFRIVYAGSLFQGRDPRIFMRALRALRDVHGVPEEAVVLQLVTGQEHFEGKHLSTWAAELGVTNMVEVRGLMPRARLLQWMAGAAVNVLVQIPSTYQIPAKLFEYMQLPAWLIAVTNPPNAISEMLSGSTGVVVPPDHDALARALEALYRRWAAGDVPEPVNDGRYDRSHRADEMRSALERVVQR